MSIEKLHDLIRDELHGWPIQTDSGPWPIDDDAACEIADVLGPKLVDLIRTELTSDEVMETVAEAIRSAETDENGDAWQNRCARAALDAVATTLGDE